jgi:hypothetical protein
MAATATPEPKTKRPSALVETRYDAAGLSISLPKASATALTKARDVCAALAAAAPTVKAKAQGIRQALDGLIDDLSRGPISVADDEDQP